MNLVIIVPADVLAPEGARTSAAKMPTSKFHMIFFKASFSIKDYNSTIIMTFSFKMADENPMSLEVLILHTTTTTAT